MKKLLFILVILNLTSSVTIFGAIAKPAPKTVVKSNSVAVPRAAVKSKSGCDGYGSYCHYTGPNTCCGECNIFNFCH